MENLLNHYDKEHMKMAMLKHEETFRHQVCELHRLYRIQKKLMNNVNAENPKKHATNPNHCPDPTRPPVREFNSRVSEIGDDLELTLGTRSYYQKKSKLASSDHPPDELPSDSGTSFSNSSSTGSSHMTGKRREELTVSRQKWPSAALELEMQPVQNQDRLFFQALSLNLT